MLKRSSDDIHCTVIADCRSAEFDAVYELYNTIFTLSEEKESRDGFIKSMDLNADCKLSRKYGPFREMWISAKDKGGNVVGGADFSVFTIPQYRVATIHITYVFSAKNRRRQGIGTKLIEEIETVAETWLATSDTQIEDIYTFCEQNAPELMSAEEYVQDSLNADIDQCDRLIWWHKRRFRRLVMNYVQPPLDPNGEPCRNMTLNVRTTAKKFPAAIVYEHLMRFFNISVLKNTIGSTLSTNETLSEISKCRYIRTCGSIKYYIDLRKAILHGSFKPENLLYPRK